MSLSITAEFLGAPEAWPAARLSLDDVHGLWGGQRLYLRGTGELVVQQVPAARFETRYAASADTAEALAVFELCVRHDVLALTFPPRPAIPDEGTTLLTLVNAAGAQQSVSKLARDPSPGLAAVYAALRALAERAVQTPPAYTGPFEAGFRPAWF